MSTRYAVELEDELAERLEEAARKSKLSVYQPDLSHNIDSPFIRDGADKLVSFRANKKRCIISLSYGFTCRGESGQADVHLFVRLLR